MKFWRWYRPKASAGNYRLTIEGTVPLQGGLCPDYAIHKEKTDNTWALVAVGDLKTKAKQCGRSCVEWGNMRHSAARIKYATLPYAATVLFYKQRGVLRSRVVAA